jgi:competence protein ComEC
VITLLVIPIGIFLLMLPVVHAIFSTTSPCQLLSPLLSVLFIPFYPAVMLLHLFNTGAIFDPLLQWLFSLPKTGQEYLLPPWAAAGYIILSLAAIRYRKAFYMLMAAAFAYAVYLFA